MAVSRVEGTDAVMFLVYSFYNVCINCCQSDIMSIWCSTVHITFLSHREICHKVKVIASAWAAKILVSTAYVFFKKMSILPKVRSNEETVIICSNVQYKVSPYPDWPYPTLTLPWLHVEYKFDLLKKNHSKVSELLQIDMTFLQQYQPVITLCFAHTTILTVKALTADSCDKAKLVTIFNYQAIIWYWSANTFYKEGSIFSKLSTNLSQKVN